MKKILSIFICICLLLTNFTISAFATGTGDVEPTISIEVADSCLGGDTLTATVKLNNAKDYTAISYRLQYDSEKMSVVSATKGSDFAGIVTLNPSYSENEIFHSVTMGTDAVSINGTLLTIDFKVNNAAEGNADFQITNIKLKDENSQALSISADNASTSITANPLIIKPVVDVDNISTGENLTLSVVTNNLSDYTAISYRLQYDSEKMSVVSATKGSDFTGIVTLNPTYSENEIFHSVTMGTEIVSINGTLLTVEFKMKDNVSGNAAFSITNLKVKDENSASIAVESGTDNVSVTCTHKDVVWNQTQDPKCNATGLKEFSCGCGYYDSEEIPTISHNYESTVVPPTKADDGYTNHVCSMCGDDYKDTTVPALGYTVEYDANGGVFTGSNQNKRPDSDLTLTSVEPTKTGYSFKGWAKTANATTAEYVAGGKYSTNEDVTLFAVWEINKYKLTYKVDGNTYKEYDVEFDSAITAEANPTKTGHTFSGWSTIPAKMPANDVTVTGTFAPNVHNVIYMVDGAEYKKVPLGYGSTITVEAEPTKTGYTFSGWSTTPATMPDEDVTVTGTFSINTYKVFYKVDGNDYKTVDVVYDSAIPAEAAPTKIGHTFSGWSTIPAKMPANNVTVTGTFSINQYTLKYMVDGTEYLTRVYDYDSLINAETEPVKADYVFDGWENLPTNMPANDVTVNAKWKRAYTISGVATFNGVATAGITVEVAGKTTTTDASGNYSIEKILPGSYTIELSKGVAQYQEEITIADANIAMENIDLKTLIEIVNVTESVKSAEDLNNLFSDADKLYVANADTNSVTYEVVGNNLDFDGLSNIIDVKAAIPSGYRDTIHGVSVDAEKTLVGTETGTTTQNDLNGLIKITIELPDGMKNQSAYTVIRTDGTSVDTITTEVNPNGEKIELSGNNIIIYAKKLGDFGIVYKQRSSGGGGSSANRPVNIKNDKGETVAQATISGSTATLKNIKETENGIISIDIEKSNKNVTTVKIPADSKALDNAKGIETSFADGTIRVDENATSIIAEQKNTVQIKLDNDSKNINTDQKKTISELEKPSVIDVEIKSNNNELSLENGKVEIEVNYEPKEDSIVLAAIIDDKGNLTDVPVTISNNTAKLSTNGSEKIVLYSVSKKDCFVLTINEKAANVFGEERQNDVAPIIRNDRTMLPARFVAENLGATVEWFGDEYKVRITKDDIEIIIYIDSDKAYVNGEEVILDSPAFIENNRTYTPVRFIAESLKAKVMWNGATNEVVIVK